MGKVYKTKEEVLEKARDIYTNGFIKFKDIDKHSFLNGPNKGDVGQMIEVDWFGLDLNNRNEKDFPEANIELKVFPYIVNRNGITAKERVSVTMINYMDEVKVDKFEDSSFWHKADSILVMRYKHEPNTEKQDCYIDDSMLLKYTDEDMQIIRKDWQTINSYIKKGRAHELSESLTTYLGACTKSVDSSKERRQPNSDTLAKPRAYCLKNSFMTHVLRSDFENENRIHTLIKDLNILNSISLEDYVVSVIKQYVGLSQEELLSRLDIQSKSKHKNSLIIRKMFDIDFAIDQSEEFSKGAIKVKTIVAYGNDYKVKEHMSFPTFKFIDIIENIWEESTIKEYFEEMKLLFVVFVKLGEKIVLRDVFFYSIPELDLEQIGVVYNKLRDILNLEVKISEKTTKKGIIHMNNLPKAKDNRVVHIRPHASKADYSINGKYSDNTGHGIWITNQSFWFNRSYIREILLNRHKKTK